MPLMAGEFQYTYLSTVYLSPTNISLQDVWEYRKPFKRPNLNLKQLNLLSLANGKEIR
jgi:hypothetical protein